MISPFASWSQPPKKIFLNDKQVHVWCASLDLPMSQVLILREILIEDELKRAEGFDLHKDCKRFIVARGILRIILSRYIHVEPGQIRFCYNSFGKPMLDAEYGGNNISFNLSHSVDLALYAITRKREVGVDIERIKPDIETERIAERFFSSDEVASLRTVSSNIHQKAFFHCWTRKEAFIKAKGKGLTIPLDSFAVSLIPGKPTELISTKFCPEEASRWSLYNLDLGINYSAALAVEGHNFKVKCWLFSI